MKKIILVFFILTVAVFAQYQFETLTFSDTTTSVLFDPPSRDYRFAGFLTPDSCGDVVTFEVETHADSTKQYALLTLLADSVYTVTLPDSTNQYAVALPEEIFGAWRYFRIVFAKATTGTIDVMWKK